MSILSEQGGKVLLDMQKSHKYHAFPEKVSHPIPQPRGCNEWDNHRQPVKW